jgi:type VI protein secretion system component Hcp
MLPVVVLADPLQKVKYERAQRDGSPHDSEVTFRSIQVPYKVDKILPKMLEAYFDGKLIHDFQT